MDALADALACTLPGGYLDRDGTLHREAELTPLTGQAEELLADREADGRPVAAVVTEILARHVARLGSIAPVTPEVARGLLVGDRQFLMLKLREATFGKRVQGTLPCPWPGCGERIDVDFATGDIPVTASDEVAASYEIELSPEAAAGPSGERADRRVSFRLPVGADQERIAPLLADRPGEALTRLLERCILTGGPEPEGRAALVEGLSARARAEIEAAMEDRAPAVGLEMEMVCPECGRSFTAPFDLRDFFLGELRTGRDLLYRQVHYLAYHYHWSEKEILEMPRDKRLGYIEILADEIEALNDAL